MSVFSKFLPESMKGMTLEEHQDKAFKRRPENISLAIANEIATLEARTVNTVKLFSPFLKGCYNAYLNELLMTPFRLEENCTLILKPLWDFTEIVRKTLEKGSDKEKPI